MMPVEIGGVLGGKYRIDRVIGRGGMGVVLMATHVHLDQKVAIKFLLPAAMKDGDAVARFVREARAAAKIKSEHVVHVHDVGILEDGTPYMVMEYLEGCDLGRVLDMLKTRMPVVDAVGYVLQVCEALAETHAAGVVHRDLKPANVYVTRAGRVKLLDFGISKIAIDQAETLPGDRAPSAGQTSLMGTPAYMAPEQMRGSRVVDPRSDIWSLGAMLYELLMGDLPFRGKAATEVRAKVLSQPPSPLDRPDLPPGLDVVVKRCLQKKASDRYASVLDLARSLAEFVPASANNVDRIERALQAGGMSDDGSPFAALPPSSRLALPTLTAHGATVSSWDGIRATMRSAPVKFWSAVIVPPLAISILAASILLLGATSKTATAPPPAPAATSLPPPSPPPPPVEPTVETAPPIPTVSASALPRVPPPATAVSPTPRAPQPPAKSPPTAPPKSTATPSEYSGGRT